MKLIPEEARAILVGMGLLAEGFSAADLRQAIPRIREEFRDKGFTAAQAATIILDGIRSGADSEGASVGSARVLTAPPEPGSTAT
jgi:hypothetical protein